MLPHTPQARSASQLYVALRDRVKLLPEALHVVGLRQGSWSLPGQQVEHAERGLCRLCPERSELVLRKQEQQALYREQT